MDIQLGTNKISPIEEVEEFPKPHVLNINPEKPTTILNISENKQNELIKNKKDNDEIKNLLKHDIRNEIFEVISKIFHTPFVTLKVYLLIFVLISTCLASYMVIETIFAYLEYKVITTSRTIFETPTIFPKVTICNTNMFQTDFAAAVLSKANENLDPKVNDIYAMKRLTLAETNELLQNILLIGVQIVNGPNFSVENRKMLGHNLDDILLMCKYNYEPCTASDFIWTFDSEYGNCYIFNSGYNSSGHKVELKRSSVPGVLFGLQIKLYVKYNEMLDIFNSFHGGTGAFIRIDNSSYLTDHNFDGIRVSAGSHSDIAIDRAFKFIMPTPYSNCEIDNTSPKISSSDLYNLIANSSYEYTQKLCIVQCFQKLALNDCNCTAGIFISLLNGDVCHSFDKNKCALQAFTKKFTQNNYIQDICLPLCPLECNITEYKTSVTSNNLNGEAFVNYVSDNLKLSSDFVYSGTKNSETIGKSIASFSVFYESLSYTNSEESPQMDIISLLANIGGHLGLFLGVSVFSLCEIIEVAIEIIFIKLKKY